MPLYYFHILDGTRRVPDDEGMNLPDLNAARREAKNSAMDLLAQWMKSHVARDLRALEIADENGAVLETKSLRTYAGLM